MQIRIKRAYAAAEDADGWRVLVDRLWPRGRSKADLRLDAWRKDLAPTDELRKWFGHDPARWEEFRRRYRAELEDGAGAVRNFLAEAREHPLVTLVYGAKDAEHNQAVVLKEYLEGLTL